MENYIIKPTKKMLEQLRTCHELQLQNLPCFPENFKSSLASLYKRGYIDTKMRTVNNKNLMTVYVTKEGEKFLETINLFKSRHDEID